MFTSEKMVKFLREKYPPGTRIRLVSMEDPYAPVAPGTEGTLVCVDDAGQFQMKWDNGRTLALIPGEDSFTVLRMYLVVDAVRFSVPVHDASDLFLLHAVFE